MPAHRPDQVLHEAGPLVQARRRIVPRLLVLAAGSRPLGRIGDVWPQLDSVLRGQVGEPVQPLEIIAAAFRLVVVPAEAAPPGADPELRHQLEVTLDLPEVLALVVILEDRKRNGLREGCERHPCDAACR
jgi:hypothetical protein